MDTALTAVEKEVYNLSLQIAQLETADDFARTNAKLQVSIDFVKVNFPASSRTKALEASISTLLRTLTVLEEKKLSAVSPTYKETRRVTVKSSRSYDDSASTSQHRSSADPYDAKPSLVYDKGWDDTSSYRAEKRHCSPSPEYQKRRQDIPLLNRSPTPPPRGDYDYHREPERLDSYDDGYQRSTRDRPVYDHEAYREREYTDARSYDRSAQRPRSRSRERRTDRYDRASTREDKRRSRDDYGDDRYYRSPERSDSQRESLSYDLPPPVQEYPDSGQDNYYPPPKPSTEYTYEPPAPATYPYAEPPPQQASVPQAYPQSTSYSYPPPPVVDPYLVPPPPIAYQPPTPTSQPLFPINVPPIMITPSLPTTLKSAMKKASVGATTSWVKEIPLIEATSHTIAASPFPIETEPKPMTEAEKILDEMSSEDATRTIIFSDLSQTTQEATFKLMLQNYGPLETFEFYIWPGVAYRGAKVVFESLRSSVTAKVKMCGMKLLGTIVHVSFGNVVPGSVLFIDEVPSEFDTEDLTSKFRLCGRVTRVTLSKQQGIGMVFYEDEDTASRALSYMRMNVKQASGIKVDMCRSSDFQKFGEVLLNSEAEAATFVPSSLDQRIDNLHKGLTSMPTQPLSVPTNESMSNTGLLTIQLNHFATGLDPEHDVIIEDIPVGPDDHTVEPALAAHFSVYTLNIVVRMYATSPTNAFRFAVIHFDRSEKALKAFRQSSRGVPLLGGRVRSVLPVTPIVLQTSREQIKRYSKREHHFVFVENLAPGVSVSRLRILFSDHGIVEDVQVHEPDHCGWIQFKLVKDALKSRKIVNGMMIGTNRVKVTTLPEVPSRVIRLLSCTLQQQHVTFSPPFVAGEFHRRVSQLIKLAVVVKTRDSRQCMLYFNSIPIAVQHFLKMELLFQGFKGRQSRPSIQDYHFAQREHEVMFYEDVPYENAVYDLHPTVPLKRQSSTPLRPLPRSPAQSVPPSPKKVTPVTPVTPPAAAAAATSLLKPAAPTAPLKPAAAVTTSKPAMTKVTKPLAWKMADNDNGVMYLHQLYPKDVIELSFNAHSSRTLIVKNIHKYKDETEASMRQRFSRYGFVVSVYATTKFFEGKVEMGISSFSVEFDQVLSAAMAMQHNSTLNEGKTFNVSFADAAPSNFVWFSFGIPGSSIHLDDRSLLDAFKEHFNITEMSVFRRMRYGFLRFSSLIDAMTAIQMSSSVKIAGQRIHFDFASNSFLQLANDILEASPLESMVIPDAFSSKNMVVSRYLLLVPRMVSMTLKDIHGMLIKYGLILDIYVLRQVGEIDKVVVEFEAVFSVQDVLQARARKWLLSMFTKVECMLPPVSDCIHSVQNQQNTITDDLKKCKHFIPLSETTYNKTGIFVNIRAAFDFAKQFTASEIKTRCSVDFASNVSRWFCYQRASRVKPVKEVVAVKKPAAAVTVKPFTAAKFKPKKFILPGVKQAEVLEYATRTLRVTNVATNINRDHVCEAFKRYGIICDVKLKLDEMFVEFDSVMACVKAMRDPSTHHLHTLCKAPHVPLKMSFEFPTWLQRKLWFGSLPMRIDGRALQLSLQESDWDLTSLKINEFNGTAIALCSSDKIAARIKCKVASESATTGMEVAFAGIAVFDIFTVLKQSISAFLPAAGNVPEGDPGYVKATRTILAQHVSQSLTNDDVVETFRKHDGYLGVRLKQNISKKMLEPEALIEFHTITAAVEVMKKREIRIKGYLITLEYAPHIPTNCIWVSNLPKPNMEEALMAKFKPFGKVFLPTFVYDGRTALVHFAVVQNAIDALCKVDRSLGGARLHIDFASQDLQDALFVNECSPKGLQEVDGHLSEDEKEHEAIYFCPSGLILIVENVAKEQVDNIRNEFARFGKVIDLVHDGNQVTLHLDSVQNAYKAMIEMNNQFIGSHQIKVRFGRIATPNVWLGNMSPATDYKAVRAMLVRFGTLASFKALPKVGQVFAEYHSESFAQLAEESLKGTKVNNCCLLSSLIGAKAALQLMAMHGMPGGDLQPESTEPPAKKAKVDEPTKSSPKPNSHPLKSMLKVSTTVTVKTPIAESKNVEMMAHSQAVAADKNVNVGPCEADAEAKKAEKSGGGYFQDHRSVVLHKEDRPVEEKKFVESSLAGPSQQMGGGDITRGGWNQQRGGGEMGGGNQPRGGGNQQRGGGHQPRGGGSQQRGGGHQPRGGGSQQKGGGHQPRGGGSQQKGGGHQPRGGGSQQRGGGNQQRGGGSQQRGGGNQQRGGGSQQRGGGNQQRGGGNQQRGGGNQQRGGGSQQRGGGHQQRGGGSQQRGGGHQQRGGRNQQRGGGSHHRGGNSWGRGQSIPVAEGGRGSGKVRVRTKRRGGGQNKNLFGWE